MWDHIINIHPSELLSIKIKESRINKSKKKRCFTIIFFFLKKKHGQFTFYTNNILTKFFKELTKYKNDY